MSYPDDEHTLYKIIEHERAQAEHYKKRSKTLDDLLHSLNEQNRLIAMAFLELLNLAEHHQFDIESDLVTRPTWNLIMEYRLRRND